MSLAVKSQEEVAAQRKTSEGPPSEPETNPWCVWGADPALGAERYELTRRKLVTFFAHRKVADPEELAGVTLIRLMRKVSAGAKVGNPELFSFGIAKKVFLEHCRREKRRRRATKELERIAVISRGPEDDEAYLLLERQLERADECIAELKEPQRTLLREYDRYPLGQAKIRQRAELAEKLKISKGALSSKIFNIRRKLRERLLKRLKSRD